MPILLVLVVVLRLLLDLLWWVELPGGASLGQVGSAGIALGLAAAVLGRWRVAATHPLRWVLAAVSALLVVGALRAADPMDAVVYGLHLGTPVLWLLALWAWAPRPGALAVWVGAGAVPAVIGLVALGSGQPSDHVLHGWPRLLGAYGNVHTHAGVMGVLAVSAAALGLRGKRWAWAIAVAAAVCLIATFVRTAWVATAVAVLGVLVAEGRWRAAAVLGGLGGLAAVASGRLADIGAVLTLTPPEGGWLALGSSRGDIWSDSLATFVAGDPVDVALGRGLGGQYGLHRHLDPHSDLLSLLYQLGPLGPVLWAAWGGLALRGVLRRDSLAFGLLLGALCTAPLSNDWLTRATVQLWVWGCVGLALRPVDGSDATPGPRRA